MVTAGAARAAPKSNKLKYRLILRKIDFLPFRGLQIRIPGNANNALLDRQCMFHTVRILRSMTSHGCEAEGVRRSQEGDEGCRFTLKQSRKRPPDVLESVLYVH